MELDSRTAQLCIEGTRAEFERRIDDAREIFRQAWDAAADDYDAAIAAHYVAHLEPDPQMALHWNLVALERGQLDGRAAEFMGSLLVSVGGAYESLGQLEEAERYFALGAEHGVDHFRPGSDTSD
jgi:thioredoxin-like negative regulator of GroEL